MEHHNSTNAPDIEHFNFKTAIIIVDNLLISYMDSWLNTKVI